MIRPAQLIKALKTVFTVVWYVNLVLAGSAILFQLINFVLKKKMVFATFLGQFSADSNALGHLNSLNNDWSVYINQLTLNPSLQIESDWSKGVILLYTLFVLSVVLFYNYQFKELFNEMNQSVEGKELFKYESIKRFETMSLFSIIAFVIGSVFSLVKIFLIEDIAVGGIIMKPIFDNQVFNLLWLAVAFYLIAMLFSVGLGLKQESDLTI